MHAPLTVYPLVEAYVRGGSTGLDLARDTSTAGPSARTSHIASTDLTNAMPRLQFSPLPRESSHMGHENTCQWGGQTIIRSSISSAMGPENQGSFDYWSAASAADPVLVPAAHGTDRKVGLTALQPANRGNVFPGDGNSSSELIR